MGDKNREMGCEINFSYALFSSGHDIGKHVLLNGDCVQHVFKEKD